MIIKNANVYLKDEGFVFRDVCIENGKFHKITEELQDAPAPGEQVFDAHGGYLIPGLVDIHFHGAVGEDFSDGSLEGMKKIGEYEARHGITSICPAGMTLPASGLLKICETAREYKNQSCHYAKLQGIHLEGPFISPEKLGAQNPAHVQSPDPALFRRLQEASGGLVRLVTLAPETRGAFVFIEEIGRYRKDEKYPVHISLGHSATDYDTAMKAFEMGVNHVTHFYNAMTSFNHREPGIIGAAMNYGLQSEDFYVELICDGVHVHPGAVRIAFEIFGEDKIVLISDSIRAAGMEDGIYTLGGLPVQVRGSRATLEDGTLAGSVSNLMDCVRMAVRMGIKLETAVRCASHNPARSIGMDQVCGEIRVGRDADCVLLDKKDLSTELVLLRGESLING